MVYVHSIPQLLSHTAIVLLVAVSIWVFCITTRADVFSDPDSGDVIEQPASGKSDLEAVTQWHRAGSDDDRQSQGMDGAHPYFDRS